MSGELERASCLVESCPILPRPVREWRRVIRQSDAADPEPWSEIDHRAERIQDSTSAKQGPAPGASEARAQGTGIVTERVRYKRLGSDDLIGRLLPPHHAGVMARSPSRSAMLSRLCRCCCGEPREPALRSANQDCDPSSSHTTKAKSHKYLPRSRSWRGPGVGWAGVDLGEEGDV